MTAVFEGFFDEEFYALSSEARKNGMRPLDHYLKIGEVTWLCAVTARSIRNITPEKYPDLGLIQGNAAVALCAFGIQKDDRRPPRQKRLASRTTN